MAAERILWTTRRFRAELEELIALARELPLLDSSEVRGAELVDTRAVIRQLYEIEGQFGEGFDEVEANARERIEAIIATVKAQPPWYVLPTRPVRAMLSAIYLLFWVPGTYRIAQNRSTMCCCCFMPGWAYRFQSAGRSSTWRNIGCWYNSRTRRS